MTILAGVILGLIFLVESFVWYVRAMSLPAYRSKSISTSNIVMYLTRVFLVVYQIILNFKIESGAGKEIVFLVGMLAMIIATFFNYWLFSSKKAIQLFWNFFLSVGSISRLLKKHQFQSEVFVIEAPFRFNVISISSFFSTLAMILVYVLPQILATFFYDYRLTLSSVGQAISFLGMLITLLILDPRLFGMHDDGDIRVGFTEYMYGRFLALLFATIVFIIIFLALT